jgi:hypothetical protein
MAEPGQEAASNAQEFILFGKPKRRDNRMLDERAGWPLNKYLECLCGLSLSSYRAAADPTDWRLDHGCCLSRM